MRRLSWPVLILQIALGISLVFAVIDFVQAWGGDAAPQGGLLWGTGGAGAEGWKYANKTRYLTSSAISIWIYAVAFVVPFVVRRRWITFLLTLGVAVIGTVADETLARLLVP